MQTRHTIEMLTKKIETALKYTTTTAALFEQSQLAVVFGIITELYEKILWSVYLTITICDK